MIGFTAEQDRFLAVLSEGERLCGKWLLQGHGARYELQQEPFVAFDLIAGNTRTADAEFSERVQPGNFVTLRVIHQGDALSAEKALDLLGTYGFHGGR